MGRMSDWLWRGYRRRLVLILELFASAAIVMGLVLPATTVVAFYLGLTRLETIVWQLTCTIVAVVGVAVSVAMSRDVVIPFKAWAAGDHSDLRLAWNSALAMPRVFARRSAVVELSLHLAVSVPVAAALGDLPLSAIVTLISGYIVVIGTGAIAISNGLHLLLRPALEELALDLPVDAAPDVRAWKFSTRLLAAVAGFTLLTGIGVPGAVLATEATVRDYTVALAVSIALSTWLLSLFHVGVVQPTVASLRDLTEATVRVRRGMLNLPTPVTSADELGDLVVAFNSMQTGLREREALHAAFGSYVDPSLAQRLLAQGTSVFEGEDIEVTVFFADVRGFTSFAEDVSPRDAVARLNALFEIMVPVLQAHGGHANHYLGDGLLAVFGAPSPMGDHADRAVEAATMIQQRVRGEFGDELKIGIGVNTGAVIAGTVGGGGRLEFTVIGDTVNVAARVEQMTKDTGDAILITEATLACLTSPLTAVVDRGEMDVRGKVRGVRVHSVDPFAGHDALRMRDLDSV